MSNGGAQVVWRARGVGASRPAVRLQPLQDLCRRGALLRVCGEAVLDEVEHSLHARWIQMRGQWGQQGGRAAGRYMQGSTTGTTHHSRGGGSQHQRQPCWAPTCGHSCGACGRRHWERLRTTTCVVSSINRMPRLKTSAASPHPLPSSCSGAASRQAAGSRQARRRRSRVG